MTAIRIAGEAALSRRNLLALGAAALAGAALGASTGCAPATPLRVAVQPWCGYQFLFVAREQGWLAPGQVQLLETTSTVESVAAIQEGRVDAAALTLDEVIRACDRGTALTVAMVFDVSAGADVVLARPGIASLAELRGKRIGVEKSSLGAIMLAGMLESAGLQPGDVVVVPMSENHVEDWSRGGMDAVLSYEPALSVLETRGLKPIFDSRDLPELIVDVLAVRSDLAQRRTDELRALTAAHFRALRLWRRNPIDTSHALSSRVGVRPDQVQAVLAGLDLPDLEYNRHLLTAPAVEITAAARRIETVLTREGMLQHPLDSARLFVPDYLPGDFE